MCTEQLIFFFWFMCIYTHCSHTDSTCGRRALFLFHHVCSAAGFYNSSAWSLKLKKKTAKYPFISCSFFSQIHSQSLASSIFHMSINGPRPGTNELTDPQFIPLCRFVCVQNVCEQQMCVFSPCMSTIACFFLFFFVLLFIPSSMSVNLWLFD